MRLCFLILLLPSLALAGSPSAFDQGFKAYQARSFEQAKALFEAYLKTNPSRNLSRTLFYLGQLEADGQKSRNYFEALISKYPKDTLTVRANLFLGQLAYTKADYSEARKRFSVVVAQFPGLSLASESQYWLGVSWLADGKPEEARREFYGLIKAYPQSKREEWARLGIGDSYLRQGNYERGLTEYQACESSFPSGETLPIVLFQIGQCYEKLGGKEEAQASYQRVIEVAPNGYEAIEAKQRLAALGKRIGEAPRPASDTSNPSTVNKPDTAKDMRDTLFAVVKPGRDTAHQPHVSGLFLQVAAFTDQGSTTPLKERLAKSRYPVTTSTKMVNGKKYYTILVGPYPGEEEARAAEFRIKAEEHISPLWIRK